MFSNKKSIIFFTKKSLIAVHVFLGLHPKSQITGQIDWTLEKLTDALKTAKKHLGSTVRILLDDDFGYIALVNVPPNTQDEKLFVKQQAETIIPENLDETIWDFKEVLLGKNQPQTGANIIQVAAIP